MLTILKKTPAAKTWTENQVCIPKKFLPSIRWRVKDAIYWELLPKKDTINAISYLAKTQ